MKLTSVSSEGRITPAALLSSGVFLDIGAASRAGLLGSTPVHELRDVVALDEPVFEATRNLVAAAESGDAGLLEKLSAGKILLNAADVGYAPCCVLGLSLRVAWRIESTWRK